MVSEDDKTNELYLNRGDGTFEDGGSRIPVTGTSNSVVVVDINSDGAPDILIGNNGQNNLLINNGKGYFKDENNKLSLYIENVKDSLCEVEYSGNLFFYFKADKQNVNLFLNLIK